MEVEIILHLTEILKNVSHIDDKLNFAFHSSEQIKESLFILEFMNVHYSF